jgi:hypothetical protein
VVFSLSEGGVLCSRCAPAGTDQRQGSTRLPAQAHRDLIALNDTAVPLPQLDAAHAAAHRRLVARFARYHMGDPGKLFALDFWERQAWTPSVTS